MFKREIVGRNLPWMATARFPDLTSQFASNLTESLNWTSWTLHRKLGWISWRRWIGTERNMRPWKGRLKLFLGRQRPIELRAVTAFPSPPPPFSLWIDLKTTENQNMGPEISHMSPGRSFWILHRANLLACKHCSADLWDAAGGCSEDYSGISGGSLLSSFFFLLLFSRSLSFFFSFFFFFLAPVLCQLLPMRLNGRGEWGAEDFLESKNDARTENIRKERAKRERYAGFHPRC